METKNNNPVCPLSGKWYLRDISVQSEGQWKVERAFEGEECMMTFEDDFLTTLACGKIIYHTRFWYSESVALLNLDGSKFDKENDCLKRISEQYRIYFEGSEELFLYSTEPGTEEAPGFQRYRFVRGE